MFTFFCTVLIKGDSGDIKKDIEIYAIYGWNDIIINTLGTLWTTNNGGSMYCGNNYEFECILDNWNCYPGKQRV